MQEKITPSSPVPIRTIKEEPSSPVFGKSLVVRKKPVVKRPSTAGKPTTPISCDCGLTAERYVPLFGGRPPIWRCPRSLLEKCSFTKPIGIPPSLSPAKRAKVIESGLSLHPNVTQRKKEKSHSSIIEFPWDDDHKEEIFQENVNYNVANYQFSLKDYDSLSDSSWLTDRVIDCFVALVLSPDFLSNAEASVLTLDSMVLECATMGLQSIFERAKQSKFICNDVWMVPTHVGRNHWILIVVLMRTKKVLILDPFGERASINSVEEHIQIVRHLMSLSHTDIFKTDIVWNEWEITAPIDMGSQSNGYDCGVCVCVWAYFISRGLTPPSVSKICASSNEIRIWMKNLLLSKAVRTECKRLTPQNDNTDDEQIYAVYSDFDSKVSNGTVKIDKPWLTLPAPVVNRGTVGGQRTVDFLASIMQNLWAATETSCGAKKCKRGKLAYFCEGCREFYHLNCIDDPRNPPEQGDYMCPKHIIVKTRTREACRPVRFRKSLE